MFDWLKKEDPNDAAMKKQQDFARKQGVLGVVAQPHDEMAYRALKQERDDITRWQQEFEKELAFMVHELKNEEQNSDGQWVPKQRRVYDPDTKTYQIITIPPLCNDWFAEEVKRQVSPFLNKNLINSNLSEAQILMKLKKTHNELICIISDNWGKHGIETTADASAIARAIKNYIDPAAFRAMGGWTKIKDTEIAKRIETHDSNNDIKKESGILGGMLHG